jgi:colicin import membrane protein
MKKNTRLSMSFSQDLKGDGQMPFMAPLAISLVCHLAFLLLFVVTPSLRFERPRTQSVINVSMVSFKKSSPATDQSAAAKKTPSVEKPKVVKKAKAPAPAKKRPKAVSKPAPKPKTSLKKKTFKSTEVVKRAIQQLEEKTAVDTRATTQTAQPEPLKSALDRLRQEVDKTDTRQPEESSTTTAPSGSATGGKPGKFNENGRKTAELIDLYRLEIAFQIQKNWAFNEQLAGGDRSLVAAIVFKVMPDGEIRDIFFTDRSGNGYLDESAYKAIVKSDPVDRHPVGLKRPYVVMAIRFTPQGIR